MDAIAKVVEGISAEISGLKEQRQAAQAEAERATEMLKELSDRKAALASGTFSGEREVAEQLTVVMSELVQALDEESEVLSRTKTCAEKAAREFDRFILEADVRYHEAEKQLAQERYETLCKERYYLDEEAEKVVAVLVEVLDDLKELYARQVRAATEANNHSLAHQDPRDTIEPWLARRHRRWLSLESLEKYDAPLPELDPLALKPEPEREGPGVESADAPAGPEGQRVTSEVSNTHSQSSQGV
jgi:chromosome segregation ATPase